MMFINGLFEKNKQICNRLHKNNKKNVYLKYYSIKKDAIHANLKLYHGIYFK